MAATYAFSIAGVVKNVRPGWSHQATANGRDTLTFSVGSRTGVYRPAEDAVVIVTEAVAILTSSVAAASVITTQEPHGLVTGQSVEIADHSGSTPAISGTYTVTVLTTTTFSIPLTVTVGGTGGTAARRLFAGTLLRPDEAGMLSQGHTPIVTAATCADYSGKTEHRYINTVLVAGTLKSMLTTICTACGFTLHPSQVDGPSLDEITCEYTRVRDLLDKLSAVTEYTWEFDEYDRLRMFLPGTEACPFNVTASNGAVVGDITVSPSRTNYANRIIVRFSERARYAYAFLTTTTNFANATEVEVAGRTYTFQTTLTNVNGHVLIGATIQASLDNLVAAITLGAGAGSVYATAMTVNASAVAQAWATNVIKVIAANAGASGNNLNCTSTHGDALWYGEGTVPTSTLTRGADQSLANTATAENLTEQAAHGIWEEVVAAADLFTLADATTMAEAYLALRTQVPKTVRYKTAMLGAKPGQTQSIVAATRGLNGTYLITEVATTRTSGLRVLRQITAIESLQVLSTKKWRDLYRQWSGGLSGSATVGVGTSVLVPGSGAMALSAHLGGSRSTSVAPTPASYQPVPNWVAYRAAAGGAATLRAWVWARNAGVSVTARLVSGTDGATFGTVVGTLAAVTSQTPVEVTLALTATAGLYYRLEILGSAAGEGVYGIGSLEGV